MIWLNRDETNEVKKVHESFLMKVKEGFRNFMSAYPEMFTEAQQESIVNQSFSVLFGFCGK